MAYKVIRKMKPGELNNYLTWMDSLYDGAYVVNKERIIVFWNKAAEQITGYSQKDVMHTACFNNILRHMDISGNDLCQTECPLQKYFTGLDFSAVLAKDSLREKGY